MTPSRAEIAAFRRELSRHYAAHGRHSLPWRRTTDPYEILVSELMLQQTQVPRVIPKYEEFLQRFPNIQSLAAAPLGDVLRAWQGLGYNRRAKYLWQAANSVVKSREMFPDTVEELVKLPGIGPNTAGAVVAYAFNRPVVFVETNIRTVYFHHFFKDRTDIDDKEVLNLVEQTITDEPRNFYWALMDYGSWLKSQGHGAVSRSRHYARQSKFAGSRRQLRGLIVRSLSAGPRSETALLQTVRDERSPSVVEELVKEGLVVRDADRLRLA